MKIISVLAISSNEEKGNASHPCWLTSGEPVLGRQAKNGGGLGEEIFCLLGMFYIPILLLTLHDLYKQEDCFS